MSLFDKRNKSSATDRLFEEKIYEEVLKEVEQGKRRDGLWAKAFANSDGNENKAKALYINYRVQSIKDEIELSSIAAEAAAKEEKRISEKEREIRLKICASTLAKKGYQLSQSGNGWLVNEPLGGKQKLNTLEELEQYANSRR